MGANGNGLDNLERGAVHWAKVYDELYGALGRLDGSLGHHQREDLAQTAILEFWVRRPNFRCDASIGTLLFAIARNHHCDGLRRERARVRWVQRRVVPRTIARPFEQILKAELVEKLLAATRRLPRSQRQVVDLFFRGRTIHEVALLCDCTPMAVRGRFKRAKHFLAQELGNSGSSGRGHILVRHSVDRL